MQTGINLHTLLSLMVDILAIAELADGKDWLGGGASDRNSERDFDHFAILVFCVIGVGGDGVAMLAGGAVAALAEIPLRILSIGNHVVHNGFLVLVGNVGLVNARQVRSNGRRSKSLVEKSVIWKAWRAG